MFPSVDIGAVQVQADALTKLTGRLEPDAVPLPEAPGIWQAFDRIERLAAGAKLVLARRVDESAVWQRAGDRDAGVWIARHQGTTVTAARIGLATSKRLAKLPVTAGALGRGELSVQQVEPIADAASHDTAAENRLLGLAGSASVSELRQECGRVKAKADPDPDERHRRIRANRRLRQGSSSDGAFSLWGCGPIEDGGELNAVLGPIIDEIFYEARGEGREESREAYAWDAIIEMARRAHEWVYGDANDPDHSSDADLDDDIEHIDEHHDAGDRKCPLDDRSDEGDMESDRDHDSSCNVDDRCHAGTADGDGVRDGCDVAAVDHQTGQQGGRTGRDRDGSSAAASSPGIEPATHRSSPGRKRQGRRPRAGRRKRMNEKYLGLLRVDLDALARGRVVGDEVCEIGGVPVPVSVARQVLGDAVLKLVVTRGQDVLSVTHLGRGPTAAQKIALRWISPTCTALGCNRTDLQHDHRIDWAKTRHTRLDELDDICTHHHDLKTTKGWALVDGKGRRAMVPPSDLRHPGTNRTRSEPRAMAA